MGDGGRGRPSARDRVVIVGEISNSTGRAITVPGTRCRRRCASTAQWFATIASGPTEANGSTAGAQSDRHCGLSGRHRSIPVTGIRARTVWSPLPPQPQTPGLLRYRRFAATAIATSGGGFRGQRRFSDEVAERREPLGRGVRRTANRARERSKYSPESALLFHS